MYFLLLSNIFKMWIFGTPLKLSFHPIFSLIDKLVKAHIASHIKLALRAKS